MNAPIKAAQIAPVSPLKVSDPEIRKLLQLAGLRFARSRAQWFEHEVTMLGVRLKAGEITSDDVDAALADMGALDLVYPELMGVE